MSRAWGAAAAVLAVWLGTAAGQAVPQAAAAHPPASAPRSAASLGEAPSLGGGARDLTAAFAMPAAPGARTDSDVTRQAAGLQVGQRAHLLNLDAGSATSAWRGADQTLAMARARVARVAPAAMRPFRGARASELNRLLAQPGVQAVSVESVALLVDEPIQLRRPDVWLDLGRSRLRATAPSIRFIVRIEAPRVTLVGGSFEAGAWAVLVDGNPDATLQGGRYEGLRGGGIVLHDAQRAVIADSRFSQIDGAAILLHAQTTGSALIDNRIVGNLGHSNWHAGLVLSDRIADVADDPDRLLRPDRYGVQEQRIDRRLRSPHDNLVAFNRIALNLSSGIYVDGAVRNVFFDNLIEGNSKEGACLDNGATANVVAMNVIRGNGKRWGMSDAALRADFVEPLGRLPDGSSRAKTPGLSLDNALYNIVYANQLDRNHGGGVKMVRSAFFNTVAANTIIDNNEGANDRFHFFGIELGAAVADIPVTDLDFAPSRGNLVIGNVIRGRHYAGIFYGTGSTDNDVIDNAIFGASDWAMEQTRRQTNRSLNNFSNLPSRNIDGGLDPNLLGLSKGRFD